MKIEAADKLRYGDLSVSVTDQYDREKRKAHYEIPDAGDSSHPGCRKFFNKRFHKQLTHNCSKPNSLMHNVLMVRHALKSFNKCCKIFKM